MTEASGSEVASGRPAEEAPTGPGVVLGVVVAPGLAQNVTAKIGADLERDLRRSYGPVDWRTDFTVDRLVVPPAPITEIFDAARQKLLSLNWDLAVVVTDLPLRVGHRLVSRHVSPTHGIALVSLPALGALHLRQRLRRTLVELVGELFGGDPNGDSRWEQNVLRELAADTGDRPGGIPFLFVPAVLLSHLRLLIGMVRANRPWRLAARLYGALVAALAAGAFGLVTSDIWRISTALSWWRLAAVCVVSITATIVAVIAVHGLWERAPDPRVRDQVVLFNVATAATVAIGIATLYVALFALILAGAALVIGTGVFERALGHAAGASEYIALAWFVASFATVGGALGAGLESHDAVREAAYASSVSEDGAADAG